MAAKKAETVQLKNVNQPGKTTSGNAEKYSAMKQALLKILPAKAPGLTVPEAKKRVLPLLPKTLFPGGATAGWWLKAVQLDLEARGTIAREKGAPVRLYHRK